MVFLELEEYLRCILSRCISAKTNAYRLAKQPLKSIAFPRTTPAVLHAEVDSPSPCRPPCIAARLRYIRGIKYRAYSYVFHNTTDNKSHSALHRRSRVNIDGGCCERARSVVSVT